MNIRVLFFLLFFCISLDAFSQNLCIEGIVVDEERMPMEFANVVLSDEKGGFLKGTITDEKGRFYLELEDSIQAVNQLLTVSFVGYETYKHIITEGHVGTIVLEAKSENLKEVVVQAPKIPYRMAGTTLTANIQTSILKDAGNAMDVLKQLPLVNVKDDVISVFGKGNALVYIDNRKLHNIEELLKLPSTKIKKVDIITTPGAQYSAAVGAVIKISTTDSIEGFSGLVHARAQKGRHWGESLMANLSYAAEKIALYADYSLQNSRMEQTQQTDVSINGSSKDLICSNDRLDLRRRFHNLGAAAEYKASDQHLFGVKYGHSFLANSHYNVFGAITSYSDSEKNAEYNQGSDYYPDGNNGNLNIFYKGKVSGWNIDINADYIFGDTKTSASYDNTESISNVQNIINSNSENDYYLGASKIELSRKIGNSSILFGCDYARTRNKSSYRNDNAELQSDLPQTSTLNKQNQLALFANYKCRLFNFEIEMGLRYEFINQLYYLNGIKEDEQSKNNSNFFPTIIASRSFLDGKMNMALSYRRVVNRPTYYQLRGDIQYNSPYSYEAGNPLLRNTYIDDINYTASYSNFNFMVSYKSYHDKTLFTISQYEDKPITISQFANVDRFKAVSAASIWDPTFFKIWNPEVEIGLEKQFLKVEDENVAHTYNHPYFYASLYNVLRFPRDYTFVVQAKYWTSCHSGLSYEHSGMYVDAFIQKPFCNKAVVVKLGAENIFNTYKEKWDMAYDNIDFKKNANNDNRFIYISFTYKFHKTKKYAGKGTRNYEQRRLNTL